MGKKQKIKAKVVIEVLADCVVTVDDAGNVIEVLEIGDINEVLDLVELVRVINVIW